MNTNRNNRNEKVTTSIKIDPELWKNVKIYCIKNNIEISEFIEKILKKYISR
ncbi:MAG: hypothetical protein J4473_05785 [Candidatus Aenigmarchaeota archaeon]|nr:hypothetical protein [Candidatus Aenigmarchaeota archaeon]